MRRLKEWWMAHTPRWAWPFSPWGGKGRPDLPERHATANELQALSLRLDRLARARAELDRWREQHRVD